MMTIDYRGEMETIIDDKTLTLKNCVLYTF